MEFELFSLSIGLTKSKSPENSSLRASMESLFFPIVRDDKMESFQSNWERWFVLTDEIEDQKRPGKLKVEFLTRNGEMYAVAPKTYYTHCLDANISKDGRKGIPKSIPLTAKNFHRALYEDDTTNEKIQINSLRLNREKVMGRCTLNRRSISSIHCKLSIGSDKISCSPLRKNGKIL